LHCELMYPSLYLKAADLRGRDVTLTIRDVTQEDLQIVGTSKTERRVIVYFVESQRRAAEKNEDEKRLVLNKTNMRTIKKMYGPETDDWKGKRVTLFPTMTKFKKEDVEAVRIRDIVP